MTCLIKSYRLGMACQSSPIMHKPGANIKQKITFANLETGGSKGREDALRNCFHLKGKKVERTHRTIFKNLSLLCIWRFYACPQGKTDIISYPQTKNRFLKLEQLVVETICHELCYLTFQRHFAALRRF